jgi:peptidoglycan DL-endopeptidase CwlO
MPRRLSHRALFAIPLVTAASLAVVPVAMAPMAASPTAATVRVPAERNAEGFDLGTAAREVAAPTAGELAAFFAVERVGVPYRYGGESPESGFDCSGLVRWSYGRVGVDVPHNSHALFGVGRPVRRASLQPGDVLFFTGLGHVGLYIGNGQMVHAPYSGKHVEIVRLSATNYGRRLIGARRIEAT